MKKSFATPYVLLTVLFWSDNMVIGRGLREAVPPLTLAFWRWTIAFLLVLPFALPHLRRQWPLLRAHWRAPLMLGLLGVGGYNTFAHIALQYTAATSATLIKSFTPLATIALAFAFLGERPAWVHLAGISLVFAGITVATRRPAT